MADSARIEDLRKRYHENPRRFFAPLANEYRKSGFLDRAMLLCEKHLAEQPDNMNGLVVYGQTLFEAGRQDEARDPFERALKLDPENLIALRQLGDIARIGGDVPAAKGWYDKVLEFDRRNDEVLELLEQMGVGASTEPTPAPRPSTNTPFISVAPTVSVSGGDAMDIGMVELDAPKAPVAGPGKTKVINAQRLANSDREQVSAAGAETLRMDAAPVAAPVATHAAPPPAARAPNRRASLLDVSFDFSEIAEASSAKPMPAAPVMGSEAAEYGFADIAPEPPTVPSAAVVAKAFVAESVELVAPAEVAEVVEVADAGLHGLELAEFSSEVSPLAGLEATEFVSEEVAPLADLEMPDDDLMDVSPLAGLDRPEYAPEDVAPLADLDALGFDLEPTAQMTAGLPMLTDTPAEPPMAIPPLTVGEVPSLADTLPIMSPWRDTPSQEPPLEPATNPRPRPRMTRADLASLPLLADYGLDDDEAVRRGTPLSTPAIPAPAAATSEPEPRASQKTPTFATETMATLYLQQGFRDKALDVYRQLVEQSPNDAALQARLAALEVGAPEMPEFDVPSAESAEPEPAPANAVLADMSFGDVGLVTPRPSSSRTPLATPTVATGPTAREFFAAFARRGLVAAAAVAAVSTAAAATEEPAAMAIEEPAAMVEEQAAVAGTGWPLDALFGAATEVRDLHAAEVLAGLATFVGPTGATGLDQLFAEPAAAPETAPATAPATALATTPATRRTVSRASQSLKFDQFFTPAATAPDAPVAPEPAVEPSKPTEPPSDGDDDLDQFQGWLQALKP